MQTREVIFMINLLQILYFYTYYYECIFIYMHMYMHIYMQKMCLIMEFKEFMIKLEQMLLRVNEANEVPISSYIGRLQ